MQIAAFFVVYGWKQISQVKVSQAKPSRAEPVRSRYLYSLECFFVCSIVNDYTKLSWRREDDTYVVIGIYINV